MLTSVTGYGIHFLFWQSFPDLTVVEVDYVIFLGCNEDGDETLQNDTMLYVS